MAGTLALAAGIARITGAVHAELQPTMPRLYNRFSKGEGRRVGDRGHELPTVTQLPFTHGMPADGGDMPIGESAETDRGLVFNKRYTHAIRLTGKSMKTLSGKNAKDFTWQRDWSKLNLDGAILAAHKMYNIYGWGIGNGRLATISTGAASATQTVDNADRDRFLRKSMRVQIVNPTTGTPGAGSPQNIISDAGTASGTTFTLGGSITSVTNDIVIINGGFNQAPTGLGAIVDDTTFAAVTFQNLSRNTFLRYRARLINAANASLSQSLLRRMLGGELFPALHELKRNEYEIWSHPAQCTAYQQLGWNKKYFEGKSKSIDLGFTSYEFEGIPWVEEIDCPKTDVFFLKWAGLMRFTTFEWDWDETTGDIWVRVPSTTAGTAFVDAFEAYYDHLNNYGCPNPQENGRIHTLAIPVGH